MGRRDLKRQGLGDNFALMALCNLLGRPAVVWRTAHPRQPPTVVMPVVGDIGVDAELLFLAMDERARGCEHFDPLLPRSVAAGRPSLHSPVSDPLPPSALEAPVHEHREQQREETLQETFEGLSFRVDGAGRVFVAPPPSATQVRDHQKKELQQETFEKPQHKGLSFRVDGAGRVFVADADLHLCPEQPRRRLRGKQVDTLPPPIDKTPSEHGKTEEVQTRRQRPGRSHARKHCSGRAGVTGAVVPCKFALQAPGEAARLSDTTKCIFCDSVRMAAALAKKSGRANVTKALRLFRGVYDQNPCIYNAALLRIPEEKLQSEFHEKVTKDVAKKTVSIQEGWDALLQNHRKRAFRDLGSKASEQVAKRIKSDRKRVEHKFFEVNHLTPPTEVDDIAANDCGLPAAGLSDRAVAVESWCKLGSWGMCEKCHSLQARWGVVRSQNFIEPQA